MMENPIKRIRKENNLTQESAASLSDVTTQVITRLEAGTLSEVPADVSEAFSYLSGELVSHIDKEYHEWIKEELKKVDLGQPAWDDDPKQQSRFFSWQAYICSGNRVPNTIHALAGLLKIHPYVLEKWSKGRMKEVPVGLVNRIKEIRELQSAD